MARQHLKHHWDPFVPIIVHLRNAWRDKGTPVVQPWDVHPYRDREDYDEPTADISILKHLLNGNFQ